MQPTYGSLPHDNTKIIISSNRIQLINTVFEHAKTAIAKRHKSHTFILHEVKLHQKHSLGMVSIASYMVKSVAVFLVQITFSSTRTIIITLGSYNGYPTKMIN